MSGADVKDFSVFQDRDFAAAEIARNWDTWVQARREAEHRWQEALQYCTAADTRSTSNVQNPWDNSTNLSKMGQIADNLEANYEPALMPNDNWFRFEADTTNSASIELRKKIEAYLRTKNRLNNFVLELKKCIRDWIYTGNCFGEVFYHTEYVYPKGSDEPVEGYTGPKFRRISPYDIVFNPLASDFDHSPKIKRTLYSIGELAKLARDARGDENNWAAKAFALARELRAASGQVGREETLKLYNLPFEGFGTSYDYLMSGTVEILTFYGDLYNVQTDDLMTNREIMVVDRRKVVSNEPITTATGFPHIFHCGWRIRPDNLWAQGPLELLVGLQYRVNHIENSKADAYDQQIDPDLVFRGTIDVIQDGARKIYISEDAAGDVRRLAPDTTILNANLEINYLMNLMEELAGAPKDAVGIRTPGEKTAFEVDQLFERSNRVFLNKVNYMQTVFLDRVINAELEVARDNVARIDTVPVVGDDDGVVEFLEITKKDLSSSGKLVAVGARHYQRQRQLVQTLQQLQQGLLADPDVKVHISGRRLAEVIVNEIMNFPKFELYKPYVRIEERTEAEKLMAAAQGELQEQEALAAAGLGEEDFLGQV